MDRLRIFITESAIMPKVSSYTRKRIQALDEFGLQPIAIFKQLVDEGLRVSYPSVARIVNKVKLTGSIDNLARSGILNEILKYD